MTPGKNAINVLIVDDEQEACTNLENILNDYVKDSVNVVGVAHNTREAEQQINRLQPDALLLDIEMPKENAFAFLERIAPLSFEVIFVTAYDEYAIRAFKLNAVDYILKPISIAELQQAIGRLKEKIALRKLMGENPDYAGLASQVANKVRGQKMTLKDNNSIDVVEFKDIFFMEAQGSYTRVSFQKDSVVKEVMMSGPLSDYEELMPGDVFFRIHKSYLVNCQHLKKIVKEEDSHMAAGAHFLLPVGRRRYAALLDFLKMHNFYNE